VEFDFGFSACLITEKKRINIEKKQDIRLAYPAIEVDSDCVVIVVYYTMFLWILIPKTIE
jgi:hypothetical protein